MKTEPISTMNMTGLRHSVAGLSLRSASGVDFHNCLRVQQTTRDPPARRPVRLADGAALT